MLSPMLETGPPATQYRVREDGFESIPIMRISSKFLSALMFGWLQFASLAAGEEVPLVDLKEGNVFDLGTQCGPLDVLVPVTPKETLDISVSPEVVSARLGNQSDEKLRKAIEASWETPPDVRAIRIMVKDYGAVARPGTYDITLGLKTTQEKAGRKLLKLQIVHPAAKLRAPLDTLVVERTRHIPGSAYLMDVVTIPLNLTEVSKRSCLTDLRIQPVRNAAIGDRQVTGHLKFLFEDQGGGPGDKMAQAKLAAGDHFGVDYKLEGDFPLGIVKGALEVTANELSDAVPLNFEVRTKLSPCLYIPLFIIAGLIVSYFLKVKLQNDITLAEARLQADKTLELAEREAARRFDSEFRAAISEPLTNLRTAIAGSNASTISKANDDMNKALTDALQKLTASKAALQNEVDDLLKITDNSWEVPKGVQEVLAKAKATMDQIIHLLANDNIAEARKTFGVFKGDLVSNLSDAITQWQQKMIGYLEDLKAAKRGIPAAVKASFATMADLVTPVIGKPKLDTGAGTDVVLQALRDTVIARRHALDVLQKLGPAVEADVTAAQKILGKLAGDKAAISTNAISELEKSVAAFISSTASGADDPGLFAAKLEAELSVMDTNWREVILGQLPSASQPSVTPLVDQQFYVEATQQAVDILTGARRPLPLNPDEPGSHAFAITGPIGHDWQLSAGLDTPLTVAGFRTIVPDISVPSRLAAVRLQDEKLLRHAKRNQSLLIGVLLVIIGYGLYWEKFTGTFSDFSLIFFWAFGLDITLDTVLKSAPKKT
jgi:hypothetical protein